MNSSLIDLVDCVFPGSFARALQYGTDLQVFGWYQPLSNLGESWSRSQHFSSWSTSCSQVKTSGRRCHTKYGNGATAWLLILHKLKQLPLPLMFSELVGFGIKHSGS